MYTFIIVFINRPLTSGKKLLPFFSICALVLIHPVKHLLSAYCMHCSSWQSGSRSQILPHTLSSCFILPPPPPSSPPTANESSILAGHSKPAQQVNQGLDMVRDAGDSGLFQKGPWSFGERENCSLLCIACLCSTPPKSRRLPVESTLQLFRNLCSNPLEGGESAPIKALS